MVLNGSQIAWGKGAFGHDNLFLKGKNENERSKSSEV
jgi:hypothetical protein